MAFKKEVSTKLIARFLIYESRDDDKCLLA